MAKLQKMLDELGEFETYRGVVKDIQDLVKKQEEAIKQSTAAAESKDLAGKKRDDLQAVQKLVREADYDFAVQFDNYR